MVPRDGHSKKDVELLRCPFTIDDQASASNYKAEGGVRVKRLGSIFHCSRDRQIVVVHNPSGALASLANEICDTAGLFSR
jgi:hypothetical protein